MSWLVPQRLKKDNIRTTYHPHSKHGIIVDSFEEYGFGVPPCLHAHHLKLWLPFHFEEEFTFAELDLDLFSVLQSPTYSSRSPRIPEIPGGFWGFWVDSSGFQA
jgi:hypothetical protein